MVIDMWYGAEYNRKRHVVPKVYWSDGRACYWGWIYDASGPTAGIIAGDFTASSLQEAEAALGVKFTTK